MKKLFVFSLLLLSACNTETTILDKVSVPLEKIPNPKCENVHFFEVIEVKDTFVLARVYSSASQSQYDYHFAYLSKEPGKVYYDDQKIVIPNGKCAFYYDSYTYRLLSGFDRTVPKVKFINDEITNPEYTKWVKENKKKEQK